MPNFDHGVAELAPLAIATPILGAAVLVVLARRVPRILVDGFALAITAAVLAMVCDVLAASTSGRVVTWAANWVPHRGYSVGIVLVNDPIGAGIAVCAAALMFLSLVYSARYFDSVQGHYHCLMLLFLAGMVGMAMTGDLFDMFCFFELMGAAAYGLTGMKIEEEESLHGALNFGIVNSLGAYITLTGIGLLYARTGTVSFPVLGNDLSHARPDALIVCSFVLVLTGFLVKGAMVPFHFWLADAHAVAPAPVCVLFSGIMVPLGIYAAFRIYWVVFSPVIAVGDVRRTFIVLGAATAVVGSVMAISQRHVKRLLAYSTIAHVGLFLVALGCLTAAGTAGALLYVAGHAGIKAALFCMAGILLDLYGTIDEHELYGRARRHRVLRWLFVIGGLGLAAMPPFGTALGKLVSEDAATSLGYSWVPALFVAVSAITGGAVLRVAGRVWFGLGPRPSPAGIRAAGVRASGGGATSGSASRSAARREDSGHGATPDVHLRRVPLSMSVPIVLMLLGALCVGALPRARAAADRAGAFFVDHAGYVRQALYASPVRTVVHARANWTAAGIGMDLLSVVLAVGIAAAAIYGRPLLHRAPGLGWVRRPVSTLHRLHSGHVGDYVAWLMVGIAVLAGFIGLPLR